MTSLEPLAGDVILLSHGDDAGPISKVIQLVTGSPYSHTILALGNGRYVEASPKGGPPDIRELSDDTLEAGLTRNDSLLLLRNKRPPERARLRDEVDRFVQRAAAGSDPVLFSEGALAGVGAVTLIGHGLLRSLDDLDVQNENDAAKAKLKRLRAAIFYALEDGDRRLFCSEFVHRALDAAGARPAMPKVGVVDLSGFPLDEPLEYALVGYWEQLKGWFAPKFDEFADWALGILELDRSSLESFDEVWDDIRKAYNADFSPSQLTVANFFTPQDYRCSSSFLPDIAERRAGTGWTPIAVP